MTSSRSALDAPSARPPVIDTPLVRRLVASQFPQWAELDVHPVAEDGWDNRTFRLGEAFTVRLPSAEGYAAQAEKEHRWLPALAPRLPLPIPFPVGRGAPEHGYPFSWTINQWLPGERADRASIDDMDAFAADLAGFLRSLSAVDTADGPPAGQHSAFRGGPLTTYDAEARESISALRDEVDAAAATDVWAAALAAVWGGDPVWFHGDVAPGNLLVEDGRLSAVIDFGCSGVGDPACDTVIAWTFFEGRSREVFREVLDVDDATWARGRGWALWKALITLLPGSGKDSREAAVARRVVREVIAEHTRKS